MAAASILAVGKKPPRSRTPHGVGRHAHLVNQAQRVGQTL